MRKRFIAAVAAILLAATAFASELRFHPLERKVIEERLKSFSRDDSEREARLKKMFSEAGCAEHISEQAVSHVKQPNLICVLPGHIEDVIIVGAHFDHVDAGEGVADNWSGASLLPSLYQGLREEQTRHTFIFIAFTAEEKGFLGSEAYVHGMSKEEVARSQAMINMDTLGLGPTEVWFTHSDTHLVTALNTVAKAMKLPLRAMNVDQVGSSDSEQFARRKIPRITIHSVTQDTFHILHSSRDRLYAIRMDNYYDTYRLIAAYLTYLDETLGQANRVNSPPAGR